MKAFAKAAVLLVVMVMISDRAWGFSSFDPLPQQPMDSLGIQTDLMQLLMFSFNDEPIDEIVSTAPRQEDREQTFWEIMSTLDRLSWLMLACGGGGAGAATSGSSGRVGNFVKGALGAVGGALACATVGDVASEINSAFEETYSWLEDAANDCEAEGGQYVYLSLGIVRGICIVD